MSFAGRIIAFITGQQPGLSEEAQRGRKQVFWISASLFLVPILNGIYAASALALEFPGYFLASTLVSIGLFTALAEGRPWARWLTVVMLCLFAVVNLIPLTLGFDEYALSHLGWGGVYAAAAWVLGRSASVQAYFDSQTGHIAIPTRAPRPPAGTRAATLPSAPTAPDVKPPVG